MDSAAMVKENVKKKKYINNGEILSISNYLNFLRNVKIHCWRFLLVIEFNTFQHVLK